MECLCYNYSLKAVGREGLMKDASSLCYFDFDHAKILSLLQVPTVNIRSTNNKVWYSTFFPGQSFESG